MRTHYDNLKVARNAPLEVIRAAYKSLAQKHHPDRNSGDPKADQIMTIINDSYEVLSDPVKRREHDLWISKMESSSADGDTLTRVTPPTPTTQPKPINPIQVIAGAIKYLINVFAAMAVQVLFYAIACGVIIGAIWLVEKVVDHFESDKPTTNSKPYTSDPPNTRLQYAKPRNAPNGRPWPTKAAYVSGYTRLNQDGLSKVTIDNSQNNADVFVKLVSIDGEQAYPTRQFFIPAYGRFILEEVSAGNYDIRYRDLETGHLSRSESFQLKEVETYNGVEYSNYKITLYKIRNGNMKTYDLSESEF